MGLIMSNDRADRGRRIFEASRFPFRSVIIPGSLALLLMLPATGGAEATAEQLRELKARIADLQQQLSQDRHAMDRSVSTLQAAEKRVAKAAAALEITERDAAAAKRRLTALEAERDGLRRHLAQDRAQLTHQLRAAYALGQQPRLKLLLNQQEPAAVGRALVYYDYFSKAQAERLTELNNRLRALADVETRLRAEKVHLDQLRDRQLVAHDRFEKERAERAIAYSALKKSLTDSEQQLDVFLSDQARLEDLLASIRSSLADIPKELGREDDFQKLRGKLEWPADGQVVAHFGRARREGRLQWRGILIAAEAGTEVRSVARGQVVFAEWLPAYGLVVIVDHGHDYLSLYGHNQALYKSAGDWVSRGELIARVGDSGGRSEPALYFEIRQGSRPQNPEIWLSASRS